MAITRDLFEGLFVVIGLMALALSVALGAAAWLTTLRTELKTAGGVFARGFLGVSAVMAMFVGIILLAMGSGRWMSRTWSSPVADSLYILALTIGVSFLAIEFGIAGTLYWRVAKSSAKGWPAFLSVISFGVCAMLTFVSLGGFIYALATWIG